MKIGADLVTRGLQLIAAWVIGSTPIYKTMDLVKWYKFQESDGAKMGYPARMKRKLERAKEMSMVKGQVFTGIWERISMAKGGPLKNASADMTAALNAYKTGPTPATLKEFHDKLNAFTQMVAKLDDEYPETPPALTEIQGSKASKK